MRCCLTLKSWLSSSTGNVPTLNRPSHAVSPRNTEKSVGQYEFTYCVQWPELCILIWGCYKLRVGEACDTCEPSQNAFYIIFFRLRYLKNAMAKYCFATGKSLQNNLRHATLKSQPPIFSGLLAKERRSNKQFFTFSPLLKLIFSLASTPWITRRVLGCVSFFRLDPFTVFVVGIKHPYRLFFLGLLSSVNRLKRILQHCATLMRHIRSFFII